MVRLLLQVWTALTREQATETKATEEPQQVPAKRSNAQDDEDATVVLDEDVPKSKKHKPEVRRARLWRKAVTRL
jgi:hypothetical protein